MSTNYSFHCKKCKVRGGSFTRQAWGWGNFNIIGSFKFLALHVRDCGAESIGVVSEYNYTGEPDCDLDPEARREFLEKAKGIFPHSNDWGFMRKAGLEPDDSWTEQALEKIGKEGDEKANK